MAANLPTSLKPIQTYLTLSKQFSKRDSIVSYYCNLYAVQQGIKLGKGDDRAKAVLIKLMDDTQTLKKQLSEEDAIKDEGIAQGHIEEVALRMFDKADNEDRNGRFHKEMIKLFYFSTHLFTILNQFGEVSEEVEHKRKYAKWKAVEIDRCLKNGITPTPGPPGSDQIFDDDDDEQSVTLQSNQVNPPNYGFNITGVTPPYPGAQPVFPGQQDSASPKPVPVPRKNIPYPDPQPPTHSVPPPTTTPTPAPPPSATPQLSGAQKDQVQKYCKYVISCLDFNDTPGAINFLEKSLKLLKTGKET